MTERVINFNPGPAALPLPVLERIRDEFICFGKTGMSILEMSHRSKDFDAIHQGTKNLLKEIYEIPDNYKILFIQGGASLQFSMIPMNFLHPGETSDYIITGSWSKKALKEAQILSSPKVAASTENEGFKRLPAKEEIKIGPKAVYAHITSNETIHGNQWKTYPQIDNVPLFCDMSSDILSRRINVASFGLIYAGAQKNLGPSGITLVLLREDLLEKCREDIPIILRYKTFVEHDSLYNTPTTFAIYIMHHVLEWIKSQGGLSAIEENNTKKGETLYRCIDSMPDFYKGCVDKDCRSYMNATFRLPSPELEERFIKEAKEQNMIGLKGHRSVGGIRVSMYNAVSLDGVSTLVSFMKDFAKKG